MDWTPVSKLFNSLPVILAYALIGVLLMFCGFKIFDWLTPQINFTRELVERQNIAVGIFVGSIIISIAAIIVAVIVS